MKKFIGVFVSYACLLTTTTADQCSCSENEVWEYCKNPCQPTCQDPERTPCPTFACLPGCVCRPGTIRDEISGKCISYQHCPAVCPINEVPNDCREQCEPTCQNQNEFQCIYQNKRCICKSGFLRDLKSGKCLAPNFCPRECGRYEEWHSCANPVCRNTCQSPFRETVCRPQACVPGCECIKGYIWDEHCKRCVPENECPNVCGIHEEWRNCSDKHCRRTCQDPKPKPCPKIMCTPGCSCKEGFIWDEQIEQCVLARECSKYCAENQEWRECSDSYCRQTCQKPYPRWCSMVCISGCSCKDGYIWDEHYKKCVCRGQCSKVCDKNAEWHESILIDDIPTCRTVLQPEASNTFFGPSFLRLRSGCVCKKGFVWEEFSRKCVLPQDCPGFSIATTISSSPATNTRPATTTAIPTTRTAVPIPTTAVPATTTVIPTTTTVVPTTTTAVPTTTTAVPTTTTAVPTTTTAVPTTTTAVPTTTTAVPTTTTAVPTTTTAVPTTTTAVPTTTTAVPTNTTAVPTTTTAVPTTTDVPTNATAVPTTTTTVSP